MIDKKETPSLFTPEIIIAAYCNGFFPMADEKSGKIKWFRPNPRAIFDLNNFHIPKSLNKLLKRKQHTVKINHNFEKVISMCSNRKEGTWISKEIQQIYVLLNHLGFAHSVEIYHNNQLTGGLYGIAINGAFFGESMFTKKSNSSKIALCELISLMKQKQMILLDAQFSNPHLEQFNILLVNDEKYFSLLQNAIHKKTQFL